MRLTLRTLLAHLDKTLDAEDDLAIATKLKESEFAANLVKRITSGMTNNQLFAPSPSSTSTADDANRISEYLDSVLPAEQITEIERICLESDMHLAEVAACHQILTMVLGNKAEVPPALRSRIYALNQQRTESSLDSVGANGTIPGTVHRVKAPAGTASGADAITKAMAANPAPAPMATTGLAAIMPVGPDDSGVSDAPTRLRDARPAKSTASGTVTPAGSRRMDAAEASALFGRPSRYVPWLVSLALVASFLFVAVQAFAPLLKKRVVADNQNAELISDKPSSGPVLSIENQAAAVLPNATNKAPTSIDPAQSPDQANEVASEVMPADSVQTDAVTRDGAELSTETEPKIVTPSDGGNEVPAPMKPLEPVVAPVVPTGVAAKAIDPAAIPAGGLTFMTTDGALCFVKKPQEVAYIQVKKDVAIPVGSEIVCPPLYRIQFAVVDQFNLTMVGPARLNIQSNEQNNIAITLKAGRILLSQMAPAAVASAGGDDSDVGGDQRAPSRSLQVNFGDETHELAFIKEGTVAALDISHYRQPGSDPEAARSSMPSIAIIATEGSIQWKTAGTETIPLATGDMVRWSPNADVVKTSVTTVPDWIDPPKANASSIDSSARDGLMSLIIANQAIDLSLRNAIGFRRSEVGSLAAQTLLLLDRPDVYFGTSGILSDPKQKAFWPDHFNTLISVVDRGPESAARVREAITQMDAAESAGIYRMLWSFSNPQLEAGSDQLLVTSLDSPNMTVRVLAAENLRKITGTSLFFKPENETALRRASDIKKWETRLRKGDIRWPEPGAK